MVSLPGAIGDKLAEAKNAVVGAVLDVSMRTAIEKTTERVKEVSGRDIDIEVDDIPNDWKDWIEKTGMNSLCNDSTWSFLDKSSYNARKVENWEKRDIKKIKITVNEKPDDDDSWIVCKVDWSEGDDYFTIVWYPRAKNWASSNHWWDGGSRSWWIINDEIVFGLQMYQLPGKCFYKSDWLEDGFEDPDPDSVSPFATVKGKRWVQFRHWIIYWYREAQWGYNWQWTEEPPPNPDGSAFDLKNILSMPSMPDLEMPSVKLPSLPGMPSMPDLPDMPSISAPSLSAPSFSAPSFSAPSLSAPSLSAPSLSAPSMPEKKLRPKSKWGCHGYIEMSGLKVKAKGKKLILSNAVVNHFWQDKSGHYDTEKKERQKIVFTCSDEEQAESWVLSLIEGGAEEGESGGCCVVA